MEMLSNQFDLKKFFDLCTYYIMTAKLQFYVEKKILLCWYFDDNNISLS